MYRVYFLSIFGMKATSWSSSSYSIYSREWGSSSESALIYIFFLGSFPFIIQFVFKWKKAIIKAYPTSELRAISTVFSRRCSWHPSFETGFSSGPITPRSTLSHKTASSISCKNCSQSFSWRAQTSRLKIWSSLSNGRTSRPLISKTFKSSTGFFSRPWKRVFEPTQRGTPSWSNSSTRESWFTIQSVWSAETSHRGSKLSRI